ncbi:hypothetical protein DPMN_122779 [Dreissena polymorpha]|uniref:Uncharacterized protein n=1 Tax=Dreissena polymorpha TaxID=45954 RepID=A0A9D4GSH9_DREPO|nr:hypothetical protein DPMN_122779 [Dreissena polymorpha]
MSAVKRDVNKKKKLVYRRTHGCTHQDRIMLYKRLPGDAVPATNHRQSQQFSVK